MWPREALLIGLIAIGLPACQLGGRDAKKLEIVEQTRDPGQVARQPVTCTDVSDVCSRLYAERAAACLDLTEAGDPRARSAMRRCAVTDFQAALAHLPGGSDRLIATRGLAEAVRIARDNQDDVASGNDLGSIAAQLQGMPGGAPYGAYYAANADLNRVLTRAVPANAGCPTLEAAQVRLSGADGQADLKPRVDDLRFQLNTAMQNRSCG